MTIKGLECQINGQGFGTVLGRGCDGQARTQMGYLRRRQSLRAAFGRNAATRAILTRTYFGPMSVEKKKIQKEKYSTSSYVECNNMYRLKGLRSRMNSVLLVTPRYWTLENKIPAREKLVKGCEI